MADACDSILKELRDGLAVLIQPLLSPVNAAPLVMHTVTAPSNFDGIVAYLDAHLVALHTKLGHPLPEGGVKKNVAEVFRFIYNYAFVRVAIVTMQPVPRVVPFKALCSVASTYLHAEGPEAKKLLAACGVTVLFPNILDEKAADNVVTNVDEARTFAYDWGYQGLKEIVMAAIPTPSTSAAPLVAEAYAYILQTLLQPACTPPQLGGKLMPALLDPEQPLPVLPPTKRRRQDDTTEAPPAKAAKHSAQATPATSAPPMYEPKEAMKMALKIVKAGDDENDEDDEDENDEDEDEDEVRPTPEEAAAEKPKPEKAAARAHFAP